jgi:hypothetical protein
VIRVIGEAIKVIGRGLVHFINALIIAFWWLLALSLLAAFAGGFIAMVGAFGGWQEIRLFGSALLKFGGMGFFFLLMLGSMGPISEPLKLNKPVQPNVAGSGEKELR